jgi:diaminopimelate epimerase
MRFAKGHGTGNDFVLLPDPDGALELGPAVVRALCDRRHGIGGDGVLRVVPTAKVAEVAHLAADAEWFMDYHNADGTVAEMCGNGIRVYARWLQRESLIDVDVRELGVATRDGVKNVQFGADPDSDITVDMGPPRLPGGGRVVTVEGREYDALEVWMGNPHVVVEVADLGDAGPLHRAPEVDPELETNVEFVVRHSADHLSMRVHERGSGETQSCGTGACAAAVAAARWAGVDGGAWTVDVPGGRLRVKWDGAGVQLSGPAEIVADGVLSAKFGARLGFAR